MTQLRASSVENFLARDPRLDSPGAACPRPRRPWGLWPRAGRGRVPGPGLLGLRLGSEADAASYVDYGWNVLGPPDHSSRETAASPGFVS